MDQLAIHRDTGGGHDTRHGDGFGVGHFLDLDLDTEFTRGILDQT